MPAEPTSRPLLVSDATVASGILQRRHGLIHGAILYIGRQSG